MSAAPALELEPAALADAAVEEGLPSRWSRTLAQITDVVELHLRGAIPDDVERLTAAIRVVVALAQYQGGRSVYLPRGDALRTALRHREIYHLHQRNWSIPRLIERYGMTERHLYRVIREQQQLEIDRLQPSLDLK